MKGGAGSTERGVMSLPGQGTKKVQAGGNAMPR